MMPISRARTKFRIADPPNSSSASSVSTTVKLVMIDRASVCRIEWLTTSANGSPEWRARFSRIRSKTTIVSCTLKPMIVSIAVTNRASISTWKKVPRIAKIPTTTITSCRSETRAVTPNFTSRNRYVIQSRIPSAPTRISTSAWLMRSLLTTGPIVVSEPCDAIGPRAASSAVTISPSLPSVGRSVLPVPADGEGDAPGDAPGLAEAEAAGEGLAVGVGLGEGVGEGLGEAEDDADGDAVADGDADAEADADADALAPALGGAVGTGVG